MVHLNVEINARVFPPEKVGIAFRKRLGTDPVVFNRCPYDQTPIGSIEQPFPERDLIIEKTVRMGLGYGVITQKKDIGTTHIMLQGRILIEFTQCIPQNLYISIMVVY